jgi:hypothetical protein
MAETQNCVDLGGKDAGVEPLGNVLPADKILNLDNILRNLPYQTER